MSLVVRAQPFLQESPDPAGDGAEIGLGIRLAGIPLNLLMPPDTAFSKNQKRQLNMFQNVWSKSGAEVPAAAQLPRARSK